LNFLASISFLHVSYLAQTNVPSIERTRSINDPFCFLPTKETMLCPFQPAQFVPFKQHAIHRLDLPRLNYFSFAKERDNPKRH